MKALKTLRRWLSKRRHRRFLNSYRAAVSDISVQMQARATAQTADYVSAHMPLVDSVSSWREVHDIAIRAAQIDGGLVLEFGVFSGTTINYIAAQSGWQIHGFDSFDGLPEAWRAGYDKGAFARAAPPQVADSVTLHVGWFDETLPKFLAELADDTRAVRYLHIDSDLYASAVTIFDGLGSRIVVGTVIVFDEYFNYTGWQDGEFKAFQEFVAARGLAYEYITYNNTHQQVAVVITQVDAEA